MRDTRSTISWRPAAAARLGNRTRCRRVRRRRRCAVRHGPRASRRWPGRRDDWPRSTRRAGRSLPSTFRRACMPTPVPCLVSPTRADLTVTFIGRKAGFYLGAGPDHCGRIVFDDLDVPAAHLHGQSGLARLLDDWVMRVALPRRARTAHKGRNGHVLVIGGGAGMGGRCTARRRSGAASRRGARHRGRASVEPWRARRPARTHERRDRHRATTCDSALERATVIALGPGLGQSPWAMEVLGAAMVAPASRWWSTRTR